MVENYRFLLKINCNASLFQKTHTNTQHWHTLSIFANLPHCISIEQHSLNFYLLKGKIDKLIHNNPDPVGRLPFLSAGKNNKANTHAFTASWKTQMKSASAEMNKKKKRKTPRFAVTKKNLTH